MRHRLPARIDLLLCAVLGAAQSLTFVHTAAWPWQMLVAGVLAWRVSEVPPGRAAALGLAFGTAWLAAGTWWLYISLHRYGGLPAILAGAAVALLSAFLSLYLALAMALFARWRSGRPARDAVLFASLWLLAELARGVIFTGFPWVASGYAHVDAPLAVLAPWIGVYGIGAVGAGLSAWMAFGAAGGSGASRGRGALGSGAMIPPRAGADSVARLVPVLVTAAVLIALALAGVAQFSQPSGTLRVTLLQGNVAQDEKFEANFMPQALAWTHLQLLAARGDLVVGPETVVPVLLDQLDQIDPDYWPDIRRHFQTGTQAALFGVPLGGAEEGYTNSAIGVSADTAHSPTGFYRYDKHHLVPFGEFIPTGFHWFTEMMNIPLGDFNRGPVTAPSFPVRGERLGANICYEDLFGEELAQRFTEPATSPTIFVNISNIGWFGDTIAIDQHLQISRMRTLEFQRPMIRATNTGATVAIDHTGRVTASLPRFTQGVLEATVQGRTGMTPFARWASFCGLWLPAALGALGVAAAARRRP